MNCADSEELLSAYLDGELSATHAQALRQHLDDCHLCLGTFEQMKQTEQQLSEYFQIQHVSMDFAERVTLRVMDARQGVQLKKFAVLVASVIAVAVGAIVVLAQSPLGVFIHAMWRLGLVVVRGLSWLPSLFGHWGIAAFAVSSLIVVGFSVYGLVKLMHAIQSEVRI